MTVSRLPSRQELLLYCLAFGCFFQQSVLFPVLPSFAAEVGLGVAAVGAVLSVRFLVPAALAANIGDWSVRLGLRRSLILAALGMAASTALYLTSASGPTLVAAQVVNGVMYLVAWISAQTYATRMPDRDKVLGIFATATAVGMAVGPILGGIALDLGGFPAAFGLYGVGGLLLALNAWGLREVPESAAGLAASATGRAAAAGVTTGGASNTTRESTRAAAAGADTRAILRRPGIQAAFLFSFLCLFMIGLRGNVLPQHLEAAGFSASVIGLVLGAGSLGQAVVRPFTQLLMRSLSLPLTILVAVGLAGAGIALIPYVTFLPMLALLTFLHGGGAGLHQSLGLVLVAEHTNDRERGRAVGLRATVNQIAVAVAPALAGLLAAFLGMGPTLTVLSLAILAAGWYVYRYVASHPGREAASDSSRSESRGDDETVATPLATDAPPAPPRDAMSEHKATHQERIRP